MLTTHKLTKAIKDLETTKMKAIKVAYKNEIIDTILIVVGVSVVTILTMVLI